MTEETKKEKKNTNNQTIPQKEQEEEVFESKVLEIRRVTRVTAGGKQLRFRAIVVLGNKNGKVGVGVAKGKDVAQAVEKATTKAKKNLITIPIVNDTIPHEVYAKYGAAEVLLRPQRKGRGLVAGGTVRVICQLAGVKNISSKILGGTRNKLNNARATIAAFQKLRVYRSPAQPPRKKFAKQISTKKN